MSCCEFWQKGVVQCLQSSTLSGNTEHFTITLVQTDIDTHLQACQHTHTCTHAPPPPPPTHTCTHSEYETGQHVVLATFMYTKITLPDYFEPGDYLFLWFSIPQCLWFQMFPMAVVCGNTSILKPSERDPGATMILMELAREAGLPPGVVNVIHGRHDGKRD